MRQSPASSKKIEQNIAENEFCKNNRRQIPRVEKVTAFYQKEWKKKPQRDNIAIKFQYTKDKEKILKASRKKNV